MDQSLKYSKFYDAQEDSEFSDALKESTPLFVNPILN